MDGATLAFPDDSFDAVISSLSTCTFPEPVAALREMSRVCKPDGRIRFLDTRPKRRRTDRTGAGLACRGPLREARLSMEPGAP